MNKIKKSQELFKEAQIHMPGGVNSPVRAFKNIGGNPIFFKKASGPYVYVLMIINILTTLVHGVQ